MPNPDKLEPYHDSPSQSKATLSEMSDYESLPQDSNEVEGAKLLPRESHDYEMEEAGAPRLRDYRSHSKTSVRSLLLSQLQSGWFKLGLMLLGLVCFGMQIGILLRPGARVQAADSRWPRKELAKINKIHYLMPATKATQNFCFCLAAAVMNDAEPTILSWGFPLVQPDVFFEKVRAVHQFLVDHADDNDIVIFVDGFDALLQRSVREVAAEFIVSGERMLFGAEKHCYGGTPPSDEMPYCNVPEAPFTKEDIWGKENRWPTSTSQQKAVPRYLNSGTMIAYAKDARELYAAVIHYWKNDTWGKKVWDDQTIFAVMYYRQQMQIKLDFEGQLIKPLWACEDEFEWQPRIASQGTRKEMLSLPPDEASKLLSAQTLNGTQPWLLHSTISKFIPGILHLPGFVKPWMMPQIQSRFWWSGSTVDRALTRRVQAVLSKTTVMMASPNTTKPFSELCDKHFLPGNYTPKALPDKHKY
ncbi:hypothetical protein PSEUBRA_002186 [Kalmanozyma brasiliensis GHG001]|uniref:uncharacterized protein n=1 Tax=Kalmanozyma brasiliensis (strain GHG001) TaxID=1365824 RepID=UPI0028680A22|nr:uncharacterized protein PSEUBRA_002186 [Kalmanozyma brasiliensis GHG001]KAF6767054.1 hypothetical protein PSEUBRA_002186 [Kalmanozyma brasiliensis GHG001]